MTDADDDWWCDGISNSELIALADEAVKDFESSRNLKISNEHGPEASGSENAATSSSEYLISSRNLKRSSPHSPDASGSENAPTSSSESKTKKATCEMTPLKKYRGRCLWVSDLMKQFWCEQFMVFGYELPCDVVENPVIKAGESIHLARAYSFEVPRDMVEDPVVQTGKTIHLARELQAHDITTVEVESSEDTFALKFLNLLTSIKALQTGCSFVREVWIFGIPFDNNIFFIGKIDEIRCDVDNYELELIELKTRLTNTFPSQSLQKPHIFQIMLYKKMFDDLIRQKISKDVIKSTFNLNLDKSFGKSVMEDMAMKDMDNLNKLLDHLFETLQALPFINQLLLEYVHQASGSTIGLKQVEYDPDWLETNFRYLCEFWTGERKHCGVDIEDAWKCDSCTFHNICEWRKHRANECFDKNKRNSPKKSKLSYRLGPFEDHS